MSDTGLYDPTKVKQVTIGVTIPLGTPYSNIRLEVMADDPDTARRCLIETLAVTLPIQNTVDRGLVDQFMRNVLVRPTIRYEPKEK